MTFSIVARDPETGWLGVAVQSHWFSVGSIVSWAEAGVGAVATQAQVEVSYGPNGLDLLRRGHRAPEALAQLVDADDDRDVRQVAFVDAMGDVAVHTGTSCIREFGHRVGEGFSVQANMMLRDTVWGAMADAYRAAPGDLPHRLLAALRAAQDEGGDIRGQQSAAILVVGMERDASAAPLLDLRVEDHAHPLDELARLVQLWRAYGHAERAEELELHGDLEGARRERVASLQLQPDHPELAFWAAIAMAGDGKIDEARRAMATADAAGRGWSELLRRMIADDQVALSEDVGRAILDEGQTPPP
jgi:uncharacterized Ntn-hydrolase superfamily protein